MEGCSIRDCCFHALGHIAVLLAQAAIERLQNAPGCPPSLPHWQHPHKHEGLTLLQTGTGQPVTIDASFKAATGCCLDQHLL